MKELLDISDEAKCFGEHARREGKQPWEAHRWMRAQVLGRTASLKYPQYCALKYRCMTLLSVPVLGL